MSRAKCSEVVGCPHDLCELMAGHRFGWVLGTHCSFASAHTTPQLHLWSTITTPATAAYTFRVYSLPLLLVVRVLFEGGRFAVVVLFMCRDV